MELHTGLPYWLIKNPLWNYYHPLTHDIEIDVAIIGSGITGALVATALCRAGIDCCVIDKRTPSTGSSVASTALLQYEIDVPLCRMTEMMPEQDAVLAYRSCLNAIDDLAETLADAKVDATFERVPSLFYASNHDGLKLIREEYGVRKKYDLPVEYLDRDELFQSMGIEAPGALINNVSAQTDTYKAATGLLSNCVQKYGMELYSHTAVTEWLRRPDGYQLKTSGGHTVRCEYVIVAAGFEAGPFLPSKLMRLTSTFALISQPVDKEVLWPGRSLIWETHEPYLYIRTDNSNRIIVGGEDIDSNNAVLRKNMLQHKCEVLAQKFRKLLPNIPFEPEMKWAGTFSTTKDGLPLIGAVGDDKHMLYALGYGGNGITFSMIASQILTRTIQGVKDPRAEVFSPMRKSLQ